MNLPNKISMIRILIIPIMVLSYYFGRSEVASYDAWTIVVPLLFIIASLTDFLDGYVARKYDLVQHLVSLLIL